MNSSGNQGRRPELALERRAIRPPQTAATFTEAGLRAAAVSIAFLCLALSLSGCAMQDWRARRIAWAEGVIRAEVKDPAAAFSHTQVTGDRRNGQICGYVKPKAGIPVRFIVYIDGGGGPYVEGGEGKIAMEQERFNFAWNYDCVGEGYTGL